MLTLLDNRIEGPVRERMLICYYRYKGSSDTHRYAYVYVYV
jgi:hypothetical protein